MECHHKSTASFACSISLGCSSTRGGVQLGFGFSFRFGFGFSIALPFVWFIWTYHCHRAASYALNTRLLQLHLAAAALCTVHCALFLPPFGPILWLLIFKFTPNFGSWLSRILIVVMAFACFSSLFPQLWKHQRTANSFQCSALQFQLATGNFTAASPLYRLPLPDSDCDSPVPSAAPSDSCR